MAEFREQAGKGLAECREQVEEVVSDMWAWVHRSGNKMVRVQASCLRG